MGYSCEGKGSAEAGGPEMNRIKFSYAWDKLKDPEFTTIRSWTQEKEDYYESWLASEFQVWKCSGILRAFYVSGI